MSKLEWHYLSAELALTCYKNQRSQQQANSMTPVTKHNREKKWEYNSGINCRICFLISCNTAKYKGSLGLGVFSVFIAKLQNNGSILNWHYSTLCTLKRHLLIYWHGHSTSPCTSNFKENNLFQYINILVLSLINILYIGSPICINNFLIWTCETIGPKICRWWFQCIHWMKDYANLRTTVKSCTLQCLLNLENQKMQSL